MVIVNHNNYVAPRLKSATITTGALFCQSPQTETDGIGLNDYDTYTGKDTGSDF